MSESLLRLLIVDDNFCGRAYAHSHEAQAKGRGSGRLLAPLAWEGK
jgi:hypothetical protein